jgi:Nucleotidyl transferase of unknown function (DUF2204)
MIDAGEKIRLPREEAPGALGREPRVQAFYRGVLQTLSAAGIPSIVGGGYAMTYHAGIRRDAKDLDLFVLPQDVQTALRVLADAGFRTALTFPHWLAKVFGGVGYIDIIFSSGNGISAVDHAWFHHAPKGQFLGIPVLLCPAEEMIWSKAFVMERERYDGADVGHLLRACADKLDWPRLLRRFEAHPRVLLSHLILFGFIYPGERARIPRWVMDDLLRRFSLERENDPREPRLCRGTLLSREQYMVDIEQWGYCDARLFPIGSMTAEHVARWTPDDGSPSKLDK